MTERQQRAEEIRDHIMNLMQRDGSWETVSGVRVWMWSRPPFTAALNTPFNPMPHRDVNAPNDMHAAAREAAPVPKRYELSVWKKGEPAKVLLLNWDADKPPRIVSFKRGLWEEELLALSA